MTLEIIIAILITAAVIDVVSDGIIGYIAIAITSGWIASKFTVDWQWMVLTWIGCTVFSLAKIRPLAFLGFSYEKSPKVSAIEKFVGASTDRNFRLMRFHIRASIWPGLFRRFEDLGQAS